MSGHWELINGSRYWVDDEDVYVPLDAMDDRDWADAMDGYPWPIL